MIGKTDTYNLFRIMRVHMRVYTRVFAWVDLVDIDIILDYHYMYKVSITYVYSIYHGISLIVS